MSSEPWHVLHVLCNHEKRVAQHLTVRSLENYLPLYSEKVKWTDRTVVAQRPLFSGYVFVRFLRNLRSSVVSVPGVIRELGHEDHNVVGDDELAQIRLGLAKGLSLRPHSGMEVGVRVKVRTGIFAGTEGTVREVRPHCRVVLTLEAVHQSFSFESEWNNLEVLSKLEIGTPTGCGALVH